MSYKLQYHNDSVLGKCLSRELVGDNAIPPNCKEWVTLNTRSAVTFSHQTSKFQLKIAQNHLYHLFFFNLLTKDLQTSLYSINILFFLVI